MNAKQIVDNLLEAMAEDEAKAILQRVLGKILDDGAAVIELGTPESAALVALVHRSSEMRGSGSHHFDDKADRAAKIRSGYHPDIGSEP